MKRTLPGFTTSTFLPLIAFVLLSSAVNAQEITDDRELMKMSIEDLMRVPIISPSKKAENTFDTPSSASVVTKEEIQRAGSTSIMEALRLVPGIIVREQTPGNYDIHLRGLDNVPPGSTFPMAANTITLVLIDNRPVYNYLQGGTFWETLPVDVHDVERIEVVRGAAAALYGTNAAAGVINIITRKIDKQGLYVVTNNQVGTHNTFLHNAAVGYKTAKLSVLASGHYQQRDRHEEEYYSWNANRKVPYTQIVNALGIRNPYPTAQERYLHPELATGKIGYNAFFNYQPKTEIDINVSIGGEDSRVTKAYGENFETVLSPATSQSQYIDLRSYVHGFTTQLSALKGTQSPSVGAQGFKYDFHTFDAYFDYTFTYGGLSIKPGINLRKAVYDDSPYWNTAMKQGLINGKKELTTQAAFITTQYNYQNKFRTIAALRADKFNQHKDPALSYQLSAIIKPEEIHAFRVSFAKASRGSFIGDSYSSLAILAVAPANPYGFKNLEYQFNGNPDAKLLTMHMAEVGYRYQLKNNILMDMEVFLQNAQNFTDLVKEKRTVDIENSKVIQANTFQNLSLQARQLGTTISLILINKRSQFKPFITLQNTYLLNYSPYYVTVEANQEENITTTGKTESHTGTSNLIGGVYWNMQAGKLNINLNPYFISGYKFKHRLSDSGLIPGDNAKTSVDDKLILNAKVSYQLFKQGSIFINARNLSNNDAPEFAFADRIGATFLGGFSFKL